MASVERCVVAVVSCNTQRRTAAALEILLGRALLFAQKAVDHASTNGFRSVIHESEGPCKSPCGSMPKIAIKTGSDSVIFAVV